MVDQLAAAYAGQPVLFVEQNVDRSLGDRQERWWAGYGSGGTVYLPLVMTDSGHQVSSGSESFRAVYAAMVDAALQRPPRARMLVTPTWNGGTLSLRVHLTNLSGVVLQRSDNYATLTALVYLETVKGVSNRVVVAAATREISGLADGASGEYTLEITPSGGRQSGMRWVVIADYQPEYTSAAFDTLQAVMGE